MTEEQITLDRMQKELREMPSSPQRLGLCQEFVALADREQARAQQISGRYDLAWAYATAGDPAKALPVCAEFLQMQKETPNTSGDPHLEAVLAVNTACLACDLACDLPQIPLEQCDALLMEFRRQVRTHGMGERLWQSYAGKVAAMTGDLRGLADHLSRFQAASRDDTSDCEVCEAGMTARFMLALGRKDEAINIAVELLKQGKYCGEEPWTLLAILTEDALNRQDLDAAERYATAMLIQPSSGPRICAGQARCCGWRRPSARERMGSNCWQSACPGRRTSGTSGCCSISIWGRRISARLTACCTLRSNSLRFPASKTVLKTACMTAPPWPGGSGTGRRRSADGLTAAMDAPITGGSCGWCEGTERTVGSSFSPDGRMRNQIGQEWSSFMEAYDDSLVAAFETALKNSFSSLRTTYNEQFYYYAFIFDSGLYPYISAWSYEALEKSIIENNIDDQERAWWKWDCCDSPYVAYGYDEFFGQVKNLLDERGRELSEDDLFDAEWKIRVASMEESLKRLDQTGFFGTGDARKSVVVNVEVVPPDIGGYYSALRLNPKSSLLSDYLECCEQPDAN